MEWEIPEIDDSKVNVLSKQLEVTKPFARILIARGYESVEVAKKFLNPRFEDLRDPFGFPDMGLAVNRILLAIQQKEHILVWGHEDVDGMTATALLVSVIQDLGGIVSWHIPKGKAVGLNPLEVCARGTSASGGNEAISRGVNIIITVDCGSSNSELPEGVDVIITDHHEFPKGKPPSFAFINPKSGYGFPWLAGVGVAYKLAQALAMSKLNLKPHQWFSVSRKLLVFVLLGTIADRVELVNENRTLVKLGKDAVFHHLILEQIGVNELIKLLGSSRALTRPDIPLFPISSGSRIRGTSGSRLGGAERVWNPNPGVEFLLADFCRDEATSPLLSKLETAKIEQDNKIEEAYSRCLATCQAGTGIILIYDDELDTNVIGVCASRLMNRESIPSIVIGRRADGILVGEARAPEGFDLIELFKGFDDIFIDWGGHKKAAGFSMPLDKLEELKYRMREVNFIRTEKPLKLDTLVKTDEITPKFLKEIELFEPFGPGNSKPLFLTQGVKKEELVAYLPDGKAGCNTPLQSGRFDVVWTVEQGKPNLKEWRSV